MKASTWLLDLVFPPKCPFCGKLLDNPRAPVCPACQPKLPWLTGPGSRRDVECSDGCWSPLAYRDRVPEAVRRYKFTRVRAYAAPFGLLMAQCMQDQPDIQADMVTWAPLSRARLRERGFDQAELLARTVGGHLALPVVRTLDKTRHTQAQSVLKQESARQANALGAYSLRPDLCLQGKRLILVDDVVTSGATLGECARLLRQAGAGKIWCLTLAQARENTSKTPQTN